MARFERPEKATWLAIRKNQTEVNKDNTATRLTRTVEPAIERFMTTCYVSFFSKIDITKTRTRRWIRPMRLPF